MKVLVTGGMGYFGCVLIRRLINDGYELRVLDSLLYGNNFRDNLSFEFIKGDIKENGALLKAMDNMDAVIHLAAIVGDPAGDLDKELTVNTNYLATRRLTEICNKKGIKLMFASTCSVYGAKPDELLNEHSELLPLSIYAISKLAAEETIEKTSHDYTIFRLGTLFGLSPRMRFDLVVNRFVAQAIQDKRIMVFGGSQYRPFIHVEDAADAFIRALDSERIGVFNLGGNNYKIIDIADIIQKKTGCEVAIFKEIVDRRNYAVDSNLAINIFKVNFKRNIDCAVDEIEGAYEDGLLKSYNEAIYNNAEWLRRSTELRH